MANDKNKPAKPEASKGDTATAEVAGKSVVLRATTLADVEKLDTLRSRKNRQTGTRINLWAPLPNGPNGGGTSTYVVQCQDHGTVVASHATRKAAKAIVYLPQHWCKGCADKVAEIQAAAKAKAEAKPAEPAATK